jgi:rhodanese-related sulfurtransferase
MDELAPRELAARHAGDTPLIVDVREAWEFDLCRIPGSVHIPLAALPTRWTELDREAEVVLVCHHGLRSQYAVGFLGEQGFARVANLAGGIDRWARDVDPAMPRY